jgi:predicted phosphodiesterase
VQVAVLADVHGNLPALRAVLAELDRDPVNAIVVAGDVVAGPMITQTLALLHTRPEPIHWISGNAEREAVAAFDGAPISDDLAGRSAGWSANAMDEQGRDELASWPIALALDGVRYCHGTPRRDDEILTRATPDDVLRDALAGVEESLVVGGHTHQQLIRNVGPDTPTYANAGSVGMPYEGRAAAFWMVVSDGTPELRATPYDLAAAIEELRTSGFPDLDDQLTGSVIKPTDPDWVTAFFEYQAGRGTDPGPERAAD